MAGLYTDARAALDYLFSRSDICQQKVIVFGRSLGGAVALRVCSEPHYAARVAAVIVENTFTSISNMARAMFDLRLLHYLPEWCYKNKVCDRCFLFISFTDCVSGCLNSCSIRMFSSEMTKFKLDSEKLKVLIQSFF